MFAGAYGLLMIAGILGSAWFWTRAAKKDSRLSIIYLGALIGALAGAKLVYLLAEGWMEVGRPDLLHRWLTGKTILGGLLFGYLGVELAKRLVGYTAPTGDRFAVITPFGLALGRIGCWTHGCCLGQPCGDHWYSLRDAAGVLRWPAVPVEFTFNLCAGLLLVWLQRRGLGRGQLFHVYLVGYGLFRFAHEFVRDTPRIVGPLSGYHLAALALIFLGLVRFHQRRSEAVSAA